MITRIKAHNFLSLKNIDLELGARTVLVGPNMSGKSNLIECLRFIRQATDLPSRADASPLQMAFLERGGFAEVAWKGEEQSPISLALTVDQPSEKPTFYSYDISFVLHEYGHPQVETEKLVLVKGANANILLDNSNGKCKSLASGQLVEGPQDMLGLEVGRFRGYGRSEGSRFLDFVHNWRFYHVVPALIRQSNPPSSEKFLHEHGENLSAWLLTLQTYPREFRRIKQACCDVLPGLDEILFQPVEARRSTTDQGQFTFVTDSAKIAVGTGETHLKKPIPLSRMSDGELAFIALVSIILAPAELSPSVLCIEEPENYLHPRLIDVLMELLDQRADEGGPQLIATTHSPLLVDKLKIDQLVVAEKVDGATKFLRPSTKKHLRGLLAQKASLGDLWYSGALSDS